MSYYGVGYRRPGGALGFQGPYHPSPGRGGRVPPIRYGGGAVAPLPKPSKPFRLSPGLRKALKDARNAGRKAAMNKRLFDGLNAAFNPYRKAKVFYTLLRYGLEGLDLIPMTPPTPGVTIQDVLTSAGWVRCCSTDPNVDTFQIYPNTNCLPDNSECSIAVSCGLTLQVPTGDIGTPISLPAMGKCTLSSEARRRGLLLGQRTSTSPSRHTITEVWGWQAPNRDAVPASTLPAPTPEVPPVYVPSPAPYFTPFPETAPIGVPAPMPMHVPYHLIPQLPKTSPWPQGRVNEEPSTPLTPKPSVDPGAGPSVQTDGRGVTAGPPHENKRPPPHTHERKRALGAGGAALKDLADFLGRYAGEGADLVDAVYWSLGRRCAGANTPQTKLKCIYDNYQTIDLDKLVANLIAMELQDRALGFVGRKMRAASRRNPFFDQGRGLQTGGAGFRFHQPSF